MTHELKRHGRLLAYAVTGLAFASACSGAPDSAEIETDPAPGDSSANESNGQIEGTVETGVFDTPYGPQTLTYVLTPEGERVHEGDVHLPAPAGEPDYRAGGVTSYLGLWLNGIVPYEDNAVSRERKVQDAMAHWQSRLNITFVRGATTGARLRFTNPSPATCAAAGYGRQGNGAQTIKVSSCAWGNVAHELGHVLGLFHEQSRTDRDLYVTVNSRCVSDAFQFKKFGSDGINIGAYDLQSIMHYGTSTNSSGCKDMVKKDGSNIVSQRKALTNLDIAGVFALYQSWAPRNAVDYDGDGRPDIAVWRADDRAGGVSEWWISQSGGGGVIVPELGRPGDVPVPGDYDGNGVMDIAVWRPSDGSWHINPDKRIEGGWTRNWGVMGDVPVPGDYDGDRKTDLAVWRPSDGVWYVILSRTNQPATAQLGETGSIPLAGDNDNDGIDDLMTFRPSDGLWLAQNSRNGVAFRTWGQQGDIPVPADYDGDGIRDRSVWRRGQWFVERSTDGVEEMKALGNSGDVPVPGDYDGDGSADRATWRATDGSWRIILSSSGTVWTGTWGVLGDSAVP
jgi:uncharacterized cupin superfamily protein